MILFGTGSLLKNAFITAIDSSVKVDYVISHSEELMTLCLKHIIPFKQSIDFNEERSFIEEKLFDGILFSINNGHIFNNEMLTIPNVKFYNIHNGLILTYRGLPEVCILNGEDSEYDVSLHEIDKGIDKGIDTGKCIDQYKFIIKNIDTFQQKMLNGVKHCHEIFAANLSKIIPVNLIMII